VREAKRGDRGGARAISRTLKIPVDRDKCQGHARCSRWRRNCSKWMNFGNAHERGDGSVPADLEDKAALARSNCPKIATEVIEE
jgi:ferredoxin